MRSWRQSWFLASQRIPSKNVFMVLLLVGLGGLATAATAYVMRTTSSPPVVGETPSPEVQGRVDEFIGPFPNWTNVKTAYGAAGDGKADDTAALQAALDGTDSERPVLWLPRGIYRITQTLQWQKEIGEMGFSLLGEDPEHTVVQWDGPRGGTMLRTLNINNSRFGRVTWDGTRKAGIIIQHTSTGSSSGNEHADEIFRDAGVGLQGGIMETAMVAEMTVSRCQFLRLSFAGISLENPNSLDWWIKHSVFEDNYVGVTTIWGQGNFHLYGNVFRRSRFADILPSFALPFTIRDNYSIGSRAFVLAGFSGNSFEMTIQGNRIIDPTVAPNPPEPPSLKSPDGLREGLNRMWPYEMKSPIMVYNFGPVMLLDNVIRSREGQKGPAVDMGEDLLSVGNTFTVQNPVASGNRLIAFDDQIVSRDSIDASEPSLPGFAPRVVRPVLEVSPGASAAAIQQKINEAAQMAGQRPVVHLPAGRYELDQTLRIPAGSDVQLIGDGAGTTVLKWLPKDGVALQVRLARAGATAYYPTLREFMIHNDHPAPANTATGVQVLSEGENVGVLMDSAEAQGWHSGLSVEGNMFVEAYAFESVNVFTQPRGDEAAIRVVGKGSSQSTTGRVNVHGAALTGSIPSFSVTDGGRLYVSGAWHEGDARVGMRLTGSGTFTLQSSLMAVAGPGAAFDIHDFAGKVSLLNIGIAADVSPELRHVTVAGNEPATKVLLAGSAPGHTRTLNISNESPTAEVGFLLNRAATPTSDGYELAQPDYYQGLDPSPHANFLRMMLAQARAERPVPWHGGKDVKRMPIFRTYAFGFHTGFHFREEK